MGPLGTEVTDKDLVLFHGANSHPFFVAALGSQTEGDRCIEIAAAPVSSSRRRRGRRRKVPAPSNPQEQLPPFQGTVERVPLVFPEAYSQESSLTRARRAPIIGKEIGIVFSCPDNTALERLVK